MKWAEMTLVFAIVLECSVLWCVNAVAVLRVDREVETGAVRTRVTEVLTSMLVVETVGVAPTMNQHVDVTQFEAPCAPTHHR